MIAKEPKQQTKSQGSTFFDANSSEQATNKRKIEENVFSIPRFGRLQLRYSGMLEDHAKHRQNVREAKPQDRLLLRFLFEYSRRELDTQDKIEADPFDWEKALGDEHKKAVPYLKGLTEAEAKSLSGNFVVELLRHETPIEKLLKDMSKNPFPFYESPSLSHMKLVLVGTVEIKQETKEQMKQIFDETKFLPLTNKIVSRSVPTKNEKMTIGELCENFDFQTQQFERISFIGCELDDNDLHDVLKFAKKIPSCKELDLAANRFGSCDPKLCLREIRKILEISTIETVDMLQTTISETELGFPNEFSDKLVLKLIWLPARYLQNDALNEIAPKHYEIWNEIIEKHKKYFEKYPYFM